MAKTTDLTSDSVDASAGFYDYRFVELGLAESVSHISATGSAAGVSTTCTQAGCSEHPDTSSPTPATPPDEPGLGLPPTR